MECLVAAAECRAVAAAEGGDKGGRIMIKVITKHKTNSIVHSAFLLVVLLAVSSMAAFGQTASKYKGKAFATADEAANALIAAVGALDVAAVKEVLGPNINDIVNPGEIERERQLGAEFAAQAKIKMAVKVDPRSKARAFLEVGEEGWPFPVPIVKSGGKWFFDMDAGRQELIYRRIGRNELDAIQVCRGFVDAQHDYALTKHDGAEVNQYAQKIISTPGKQDGLAWKNADGTWGGSIGERAAKELDKLFTQTGAAFHGYYFKVLTGQGPAAHLGSLNYIQKGAMIGGFALLAYPAIYQVTGVKTFMVSHDGVVYEKDLGQNTIDLAKAIELFNPDRTWTPVKDE